MIKVHLRDGTVIHESTASIGQREGREPITFTAPTALEGAIRGGLIVGDEAHSPARIHYNQVAEVAVVDDRLLVTVQIRQ